MDFNEGCPLDSRRKRLYFTPLSVKFPAPSMRLGGGGFTRLVYKRSSSCNIVEENYTAQSPLWHCSLKSRKEDRPQVSKERFFFSLTIKLKQAKQKQNKSDHNEKSTHTHTQKKKKKPANFKRRFRLIYRKISKTLMHLLAIYKAMNSTKVKYDVCFQSS